MPLDRAHVTVASRVMLPVYVLFFTVVGLSFATTDTHRLTATPMLDYANRLLSLRLWGAMFLVCSVLMLAAMLLSWRTLYRYGLLVCAFSMCAWSAVAILGIFTQPVSYSAWVWPAFVAAACTATNRSLAAGERDQENKRRAG